MSVYEAIVRVQGDLARVGVSKDQTNTFDRYNFRGIDDVYNALAPLLAKHSLCILPKVLSRESVERISQKGQPLFYIVVTVEYAFVSAVDGSSHTVVSVGEAMDRGDKGTTKALSAAFKYACFQAFCIPTEGDNDADSSTHTVAHPNSKEAKEAKQMARENHPVAPIIAGYLADESQWDLAREALAEITEEEEKKAIWKLFNSKEKEIIQKLKVL